MSALNLVFSRPRLHVAGFAIALVTTVSAQCTPEWQSGNDLSAPAGTITKSLIWDPDGIGSAPAVLVVAGHFAVGAMPATCIATYDGVRWESVGSPPHDWVTALGVYNGRLIAAFDDALSAQTLAAWDGTIWQPIARIAGQVRAMTVYGGELVVTGRFATVDQLIVANIARWNGTSWSALRSASGTPGLGDAGYALAVYSNLLYVGGAFRSAGSTASRHLAVWNGAGWAPAGDPDGVVNTLGVRTTSNIVTSFLFAGGAFTRIGGIPALYVARYNTASNAWSALGSGVPSPECRTLYVRNLGPTGYELLAGVHPPVPGQRVMRWNGSNHLWRGGSARVQPSGSVSSRGLIATARSISIVERSRPGR